MHAFTYHRPAAAREAGELFGRSPDARYLAGGQSLIPTLKMRLSAPRDLIDVTALPGLSGIVVQGDTLRIGAATTHAEVAQSVDVGRLIPALAELAAGIGDRQVRNRGTIGGSLANNDPAACYPAAVLALDATVHTDRRDIRADEFFRAMYETALARGEMITAVTFTAPKRAAYVKFKQPASRFALVGVFVAQTAGGARCAVTGAASCVFRATAIETALSSRFAPEMLDGVSWPEAELNTDIHATSAYRAHLIPVLTRRAVAAALAAG